MPTGIENLKAPAIDPHDRAERPRRVQICVTPPKPSCASAPFRVLFLILAVCLASFPTYCFGGGILHVFPPTFNDQAFPVARPIVLSSKTAVTISESAIEYRIDQTFLNDNEFPLSGLFLLPLGENEAVDRMEVKIDGVPTPYTVKSANDFFLTLREMATAMKDPSLLGLAGKRILEVKPVTMGIRKQVSVRVQYEEPFSVQNDEMELILPMAGERYSLAPVGELEILVRFKMSRAVRNLLSPSHHMSIIRETPGRCLVTARNHEKRVRDDFCLLTTFGEDELDMKLFSHRPPGGKGAFMLLLSPPLVPPQEKEPDKDVVFVLDTSASMGPSSLDWAKRAVILGLSRLSPPDRFNVVIVGTRSSRMAEQLAIATRENLLKAVNFVNSAKSAGGTDLYNSLMDSLEQFTSRRRPSMIMFVGDGRATVGVTKPDAIIEAVRRNNRARARIFILAVGDRADVAMLDKLAVSNKGGSFRLDETQDFQTVVDRFFAGASPPRASDLGLEFHDVETEEIDPNPLPDMFGQDGIAVLGRYKGKKDVESTVRLRCKVKGRPKALTESFTFPVVQRGHSYVSSIWAMRRMARLLEHQQMKGPEPEVTIQIANLASEFGLRVPGKTEKETSRPADLDKDVGGLLWRFKTSCVVSDVSSDLFRRVNDKLFRLEKSEWVDAGYHASAPARTVQFLSEEYFSILRDEPDLGGCLALGPAVTVVAASGAIKITSKGEGRPRR